jgi:hypothetical protein
MEANCFPLAQAHSPFRQPVGRIQAVIAKPPSQLVNAGEARAKNRSREQGALSSSLPLQPPFRIPLPSSGPTASL